MNRCVGNCYKLDGQTKNLSTRKKNWVGKYYFLIKGKEISSWTIGQPAPTLLRNTHIIQLIVFFCIRVLVSAGAKGASAPVNLGQRVHAPVNIQA